MTVSQLPPVVVRIRGQVPAEMRDFAIVKITAALKHSARPVLSARVVLSSAPDPAVARPAAASAQLSVNGRAVHAHADAETMRNAIELLAGRIRVRLSKATKDLTDIRTTAPEHGPLVPARPDFRP
jgi:ribosome-associated translation inhibitor RaiA